MQQRYYDPVAMRFLSVDPVAASPLSFSRYWYANNNPYKNIDPDGRAALVTYQKDGSIKIELPTKFMGKDATPENIKAVKDSFSKLSGQYKIGGKDVNVKFEITEFNKNTPREARNLVVLRKGPTDRGEGGRSYANKVGGNFSVIDTNDRFDLGVPVHELLHLTGAADKYKTPVPPGWDGNIMNKVPGSFESKNFDEILTNTANVYRHDQ